MQHAFQFRSKYRKQPLIAFMEKVYVKSFTNAVVGLPVLVKLQAKNLKHCKYELHHKYFSTILHRC